MSRERPLWILLIVFLLGLGILISQILPQSAEVRQRGLQEGLWTTRKADLLVHLALLLMGALGIRALLPEAGEED